MDFYQRLGARLRTLRLRAGLSQSAVGARLGRSAGAINRYEMGRRRVPLRDLPRLAALFGVAPAALLGAGTAADRIGETPAVYAGRRGARSTAAPSMREDIYADFLSPVRLRKLARQARLDETGDPELRRYATLILRDFGRYTKRRR